MRPLQLSCLVLLVSCGGNNNAAPDGGLAADAHPPNPMTCNIAACADGFARTCDNSPIALVCSSFGGSCETFTATDGTQFGWCGCGPIAEGQGKCLNGADAVTCQQGLALPAQCLPGTTCVVDPTMQYGLRCDCDNLADGVCPDPACTGDPDCNSCTPSCAGKTCGDNGCGGSCGSCGIGTTCSGGSCVPTCTPNCSGKQCGDDGCGGSCGTCMGTCSSTGQCMGTCVPSCTGKQCGSDGCGGSCGTCTGGLSCSLENKCDCDFFATLTYNFALDTAATWPSNFSFIGLNVQNINLDGSPGSTNGWFLQLQPSTEAMKSWTVYGCKPDIHISAEYAVSGVTCTYDMTLTGRLSFKFEPPVINADGSCTAPAP